MNGLRLKAPTQDAIVEFVLRVATGELDDVADIAATLNEWSSAARP